MRLGVPLGSVFFQKIEQLNQSLSHLGNSPLFEAPFPVGNFVPLIDSL